MKLNELLKREVNKSYDELLYIAKCAMVDLLPLCKALDAENGGVVMLLNVILTAVASDGKLSSLETKFVADLIGIDKDKLMKMLGSAIKPEAMDLTDKFADSLNQDGKASVVALIVAVIACDGRVTPEENAFLRKVIS